jgi:riboflavin synthase
MPLIAAKGSVAVDGVSLTVIEAGDREFSVGLIPESLARTTLSGASSGSEVNLEADLIARYLQRLLSLRGLPGEKAGGISWATLAEGGWV